jgi:outer membrane protein assembly factor BamD
VLTRLFLVLALAVAASACGGKGGATSVDYSVSAQKNYDKGMKELERQDWIAASKYFGFIKSRFPYSKYAVLAELRLADAEFGAEQFLEAIDAYRLFIKFHPTHEMVANGYASFRIGEAYFKQLPGDFWLFPPSYEKDQSSTEDAANELKSFLDKYPDSPYRDKAKDILVKVGKRLASGTSRAITGATTSRWAPCSACAACSSATAASATTRKPSGCSAAPTSPSTWSTARG